MEAHQRRGFLQAVEAHVVAKGAIPQGFARGDGSFQHDFAVAGHLQINGFAARQMHTCSGIQAGKEPFTELHRDRCGGGHHQQRVHPQGHGDLKFFAPFSRLAQVTRASAHAQPVHGHAAGILLLQPVDPHIGNLGFWVFGDHQTQGDHPAGIAGPGANQRQLIEIQLSLRHHLLMAAGRQVTVGSGFDQIPEHTRKAG